MTVQSIKRVITPEQRLRNNLNKKEKYLSRNPDERARLLQYKRLWRFKKLAIKRGIIEAPPVIITQQRTKITHQNILEYIQSRNVTVKTTQSRCRYLDLIFTIFKTDKLKNDHDLLPVLMEKGGDVNYVHDEIMKLPIRGGNIGYGIDAQVQLFNVLKIIIDEYINPIIKSENHSEYEQLLKMLIDYQVKVDLLKTSNKEAREEKLIHKESYPTY